MKMTKQDFIVETGYHCFICWSNGGPPPKSSSVKVEEDFSKTALPTYYSIQSLSRFLKLDMGVVFNDTKHISPQLLKEVKRSRLKSELCKECHHLIERFSKLFLQVEKLEMDIASYLENIYGKMLKAEEDWKKTDSVKKLFGETPSGDQVGGKLQIVGAIRREALSKCHRKLQNISPRVKVENLNRKSLAKSTSQSNYEYSPVVPKMEHINFSTDELNMGNKDYMESCDMDENSSEAESPPDHNDFDESENDEGGQLPKPDANKTSRAPTLRTVYHCTICRKTFSSPAVLGSHMKSKECNEMEADLASDDNDFDSKEPAIHGNKIDVDAFEPTLTSDAKPHFQKRSKRKKVRQLQSRSRKMSTDFIFDQKTGLQKCSICSKTFAKYQTAWRHFKTVHKKVREKCNLCGKEFRQAGSLTRHRLSAHTKIRFTCPGCHKIYKQKGHLREHQKICNTEPSHL